MYLGWWGSHTEQVWEQVGQQEQKERTHRGMLLIQPILRLRGNSSSMAPPKFFLGEGASSQESGATPSPARPRKSALKKYNPYHTFSGKLSAQFRFIVDSFQNEI